MTSDINIFFSIVIIYLADATGHRRMACYGTTLSWLCCVFVGILGVVPYTAGFAAASTCVVGTVIGIVLPYMINAEQWNWGLKTSWLMLAWAPPLPWFLVPETKGRSAAELDELFQRKIKPYCFHKTATVAQRMVEINGEERA